LLGFKDTKRCNRLDILLKLLLRAAFPKVVVFGNAVIIEVSGRFLVARAMSAD
jgi:hypothetical protein